MAPNKGVQKTKVTPHEALKYLKHKKYPQNVSQNAKRAIRRAAQNNYKVSILLINIIVYMHYIVQVYIFNICL